MKILITVLTAIGMMASTALASEVDQGNSSFKWSATKKVGDGHTGNIFLKSSKVEMKGDKLKNAEFIMDMTSFDVDELKGEWKTKFLGHVKSGDFFEVNKHPQAKLVLTELKGEHAYGKLTIKGKTNPVKIKFTKKDNKYTGQLKFDRTKYGIIYGSKNFFKKLAMDKIINNEVVLDFNVALKK